MARPRRQIVFDMPNRKPSALEEAIYELCFREDAQHVMGAVEGVYYRIIRENYPEMLDAWRKRFIEFHDEVQ